MINNKLYLLLFAALLLSGCNLIYKQSIQQGNAIEQDDVDDLSLGMSKRQVSLIMGTPAIADPFHRDRWDYIYTFRPQNNAGSQRNISLYFEDDALTKIDDKGFRKTGEGAPGETPDAEESVTPDETEPEATITDAEEIIAPAESEPEATVTDAEESTTPAEIDAGATVADAAANEVAATESEVSASDILATDPEETSESDVVIDQVDEVSGSAQEFVATILPNAEYYSVQLGNFTEMDNAETLRAAVIDAGHEATVEVTADQEPIRYRVLSGHLSEQSAAEALVEKLDTDTGHYGFVVKIEASGN